MEPLTYVGQIVHYNWEGNCRPAIIVRKHGGSILGLVVFIDGENDVTTLMGAQVTSVHRVAKFGDPESRGMWHYGGECDDEDFV